MSKGMHVERQITEVTDPKQFLESKKEYLKGVLQTLADDRQHNEGAVIVNTQARLQRIAKKLGVETELE